MAVLTCVVVALSAGAQQQTKSNALHVFLANPSFGWSEGGGDSYDGALGIAYQRRFAANWAAELSVSRENHSSTFLRYDHEGYVIERATQKWDATPVDLAVFYQFPNRSAWKPYLGAAVRYVDTPRGLFDDRNTAFGLNGGVVWQFRENLGLRFDAKVLANAPNATDTFNLSVGLAWRF